MYDMLKRKCNNVKKFYEREYKLNAKTQFDKGRAIGSIQAYKYILKEIEKLEEYINKKNSYPAGRRFKSHLRYHLKN